MRSFSKRSIVLKEPRQPLTSILYEYFEVNKPLGGRGEFGDVGRMR
jgi:hypothetical protein